MKNMQAGWRRFFLRCSFLLVVFSLASCNQQQTIVNGVDEKEANEIVVLMASHGIPAVKEPMPTSGGAGGSGDMQWNIAVSGQDTTRAMSILNRNGLPRREGQSLLGLFSKQGLVPSDREEAIRYQAGLASQLANTIRKWEGIVDADVSFSFPDSDEAERGVPMTASVYVKHQGVLDDPNSQIVPKIKRYIAGAVVGLDYSNITVVGDKVRVSEEIVPGNAPSATLRKVWGVSIAETSVTRFQMIFFAFCLLFVVFVAALAWVGWRLFPVLGHLGGFKAFLLNAKPVEWKKEQKETSPAAQSSQEPAPEEEPVDLEGLGHHGFEEDE